MTAWRPVVVATPDLLQIAGLPRSTFYDHRRRLSRGDTRIDIKEAIRGAFEAANSAYGHRRILSVLLRQGWRVSKKTVLKLMRELGLQFPVRRRKRYNSFRGEVGEAADNVLNRKFETGFRHTKWATDVTEFNIGSSKVYVSPILDLYDNRIISATAGPSPSVKMVTDGLRIAIETLNACLTFGSTPLLRQYFPKGTDLAVHTPEHLATVADQLNRRPREVLGWVGPLEHLTNWPHHSQIHKPLQRPLKSAAHEMAHFSTSADTIWVFANAAGIIPSGGASSLHQFRPSGDATFGIVKVCPSRRHRDSLV